MHNDHFAIWIRSTVILGLLSLTLYILYNNEKVAIYLALTTVIFFILYPPIIIIYIIRKYTKEPNVTIRFHNMENIV